MRPQPIALNPTFTICWARLYPLAATFWRYAQDSYVSTLIFAILNAFWAVFVRVIVFKVRTEEEVDGSPEHNCDPYSTCATSMI